MERVPRTDLDVYEICLGGNVLGWTAGRDDSFAVLDAYLDAGGNFIDSADSYSSFVPGHSGGESESMLGEWLAARPGARDRVVLATKVSRHPEFKGLAPDNIGAAAEASLARLGTDRIDLYYAHQDDPDVPLAETLGTFAELIEAGKVRHVAASNYSAPRLAEALRVADAEGLPRYVALQPHYSLVERGEFEGALQGLCHDEGLAVFPYWSLARGFLTGKYRPGGEDVDSPRAGAAGRYLDERGIALLAALDEVAAAHSVEVATVALAWLRAQPTVLGPVASARNTAQLGPLIAAAALELSPAELERLDAATR
ncbi:MAG TPA: aldo/keto reductase [Solirubrobacterales bacterium]|nr:aldo/keto reductase [Solirubrobacterales bacterium]